MTDEAYCAEKLRLLESEVFIAIGDGNMARKLISNFEEDLRVGRSESLPDLLSIKTENTQQVFRLREVKFKLEERLISKALKQLGSGLKLLAKSFPSSTIDRVEIVLALRDRKLKRAESSFLGEPVCSNRYRLNFRGQPYLQNELYGRHGVTVLVL